MTAFLWSPFGRSFDLRGPQKKWERLTKGRATSTGTWYYGPIEDLPVAAIPSTGWVVDCHNVWDHEPTQKTILKNITPMCIISYVKFNGRLAEMALLAAEGQDRQMSIIIVYQHAHKATVMLQLRKAGHNPLGLIDDRWTNLEYVLAAGFKAILCLTAVQKDVAATEGLAAASARNTPVIYNTSELDTILNETHKNVSKDISERIRNASPIEKSAFLDFLLQRDRETIISWGSQFFG